MFPYSRPMRVPPLLNNPPYLSPFLLRRAAFPSPLDLSVRASIPITPPTTPSPPRKRALLDSDIEVKESQWKSRIGYFEENILNSPPLFWKWNQSNVQTEQSSISEKQIAEPATPKAPNTNPIVTTNLSHTNFGYFDCKIFESKVEETQSGNQIDVVPDLPDSESLSDDVAVESDEDAFVDVLTQDDTDPPSPKNICPVEPGNDSSNDSVIEVLNDDDDEEDDDESVQTADESDSVLHRNEIVYRDEEMHIKAIEGFAELFEKSLHSQVKNSESRASPSNDSSDHVASCHTAPPKPERKKVKLKRQQNIDEDNTSPVSGTIIRKLRDGEELVVRKGDIDPAFNVVEITDEAKELLSKIDNRIGSYICQLCRALYDDAFQLAQHRCSRIVHIEYKCAECDKVFNCPANLASHKRWHKPRPNLALSKNSSGNAVGEKTKSASGDDDSETGYPCKDCGKVFRRLAYLKKHSLSHQGFCDMETTETPNAVLNSIQLPAVSHYNQSLPFRPYATVSSNFAAMFPNIEHRHFNKIREFYFQQTERLSAFHCVRQMELEKSAKRGIQFEGVNGANYMPLHMVK